MRPKKLVENFLKGLLLLVPITATGYVVYLTVSSVDRLLRVPVPGLGLVITFFAIALVGFLASNMVGRRILGWVEGLIGRVPVVKLLYSSVKDLMGAFVGDRRTFNKPVMVRISEDGALRLFGFVTRETFDDPKMDGHVAVYLPHSYAFAGNVMLVPRDRIETVDADSAQFMAFVVSGGVAELHGAQTVAE